MGDKPKGNLIKTGKGMRFSACDHKGNVYFTSNGGKTWIMYSANGSSKEFESLSSDHFALIKEGH
jgi:photosystem II stability/assembly factor-like uncharacterized protein